MEVEKFFEFQANDSDRKRAQRPSIRIKETQFQEAYKICAINSMRIIF
jgi:hypothetical protein